LAKGLIGMNTRDGYLQEVASQLSRMESTISSLKLRVEETAPEIAPEFYHHWNKLRCQQGSLETQLNALREAEEGSWRELCKMIDHNLQELNGLIESLGPWVWTGLADNVWKFR
jgi:hypothetical protein